MIKIIFSFLVLFVMISLLIETWRGLTGKKRWDVVKTLVYGASISFLVVLILTSIVIIF